MSIKLNLKEATIAAKIQILRRKRRLDYNEERELIELQQNLFFIRKGIL